MNAQRNREYLEAKVNTASSARLHLMLIEGAIRFGREAEKGLMRGDEQAAHPPLLRAMAVVEEMLAAVRDGDSEINRKLSELYKFVFVRLTSTYVNADHKMMAEALAILEYERETWRLACEKSDEGAAAGKGSAEPRAKTPPAPKPHLDGLAPSESLSFEA